MAVSREKTIENSEQRDEVSSLWKLLVFAQKWLLSSLHGGVRSVAWLSVFSGDLPRKAFQVNSQWADHSPQRFWCNVMCCSVFSLLPSLAFPQFCSVSQQTTSPRLPCYWLPGSCGWWEASAGKQGEGRNESISFHLTAWAGTSKAGSSGSSWPQLLPVTQVSKVPDCHPLPQFCFQQVACSRNLGTLALLWGLQPWGRWWFLQAAVFSFLTGPRVPSPLFITFANNPLYWFPLVKGPGEDFVFLLDPVKCMWGDHGIDPLYWWEADEGGRASGSQTRSHGTFFTSTLQEPIALPAPGDLMSLPAGRVWNKYVLSFLKVMNRWLCYTRGGRLSINNRISEIVTLNLPQAEPAMYEWYAETSPSCSGVGRGYDWLGTAAG